LNHSLCLQFDWILIGTTANLAQDNCRIHTARHLQESYKANNVNLNSWNLNIVENIWKTISDPVYGGIQPISFNELWLKINEAADIVKDEKRLVILNLYQTFRNILATVLVKKGNIINWTCVVLFLLK